MLTSVTLIWGIRSEGLIKSADGRSLVAVQGWCWETLPLLQSSCSALRHLDTSKEWMAMLVDLVCLTSIDLSKKGQAGKRHGPGKPITDDVLNVCNV